MIERKLSYAYARHALEKIATITFGALVVSELGRRARRALAAIGRQRQMPKVRTAILAHAYHVELLDEILACRDVLPELVPLHLTVPIARFDLVRRRTEGLPAVVLHPCENRGRDIAPFLAVLGSGGLDGYDAVLKLHTKRSPHLRDGEIRRKLLFDMLCGERNATLLALTAFEDRRTGMVGWRGCFRTRPFYWMLNEARVREIAGRMEVRGDARLGFFEGSMFWFRPAALAALTELKLRPEDFEAEALQLDGTLHHAIERCFTIAAWARGYNVRDLHGRVLG
ncbi:rhamnan synthesis F family protein [Bosea sp. CCNWLW174]|uniref:rhamnan synthesis F family protein n=1 Tax=unclassified Bosea (in: a-proteobacteria) TaxID=2653178 RepID=UPI00301491F8